MAGGRLGQEGPALLREAKHVKVLLPNDIGDEKRTEAVTAELKEIIEHRTPPAACRCCGAANLTPDRIKATHGEHGAAIVRRLSEFAWAG